MNNRKVVDIIYSKRKTLFVGMDMHKHQHTAVIIDHWCNVVGSITFPNIPGKFDSFLKFVKDASKDLNFVFGLEDTRGFGRNLSVYLEGHKYVVKHVNPAHTTSYRNSSPMTKKDDDHDAFCVAKALRDLIDTLPDANNQDIFWTIRQIVKRRDSVSKNLVISKNQLHTHIMYSYPSYKKFFKEIDCKTSLNFFNKYPSPDYLGGITPGELLKVLKETHSGYSLKKANDILNIVAGDDVPFKEFQNERDFITRKIIKELEFRKIELEDIEKQLEQLIPLTGYKLETLPGIGTVMAANLISEIGDVNRFPNSDKLARFSGVAPVNFSSAGKGKAERCRQGNRVLNAIFHFLAIQLVVVSKDGVARHPIFREYFERKVSEGKTKSQALVCISRRAVNIVYGMMKSKTEYKPYEKKVNEIVKTVS